MQFGLCIIMWWDSWSLLNNYEFISSFYYLIFDIVIKIEFEFLFIFLVKLEQIYVCESI